MTLHDAIAKMQAVTQCEHAKTPGEPCDAGNSWWTCACAVTADKMVSQIQRNLASQQDANNGRR